VNGTATSNGGDHSSASASTVVAGTIRNASSSSAVADVGTSSKRMMRRNMPLPLQVKKDNSSPSTGFAAARTYNLTSAEVVAAQLSTEAQSQSQGEERRREEGWMRSRIARQAQAQVGEKPRYGVRIRW